MPFSINLQSHNSFSIRCTELHLMSLEISKASFANPAVRSKQLKFLGSVFKQF